MAAMPRLRRSGGEIHPVAPAIDAEVLGEITAMSWLNNIRIPVRIAIACLIPMLAFTGFAGKALLEKRAEYTKADQIAEIAATVPTITALVHELQKERGSSMGYVHSKGKQATFVHALRNQRPVVDKKVADWQQRTAEFAQRYAGSKIAATSTAPGRSLPVFQPCARRSIRSPASRRTSSTTTVRSSRCWRRRS